MTTPRIIINTGDGKGKTTAALGMAVRAVGHHQHVCILQFIKNDDTVGEVAGLAHLPGVSLLQCGEGFVPKPENTGFQKHTDAAARGLQKARNRIEEGNFDLLILDEICGAVSMGLLDEDEVIDMIQSAPATLTVVLTGRGATEKLIALADTVTDMTCVKHGYDANRPAQKGVEH